MAVPLPPALAGAELPRAIRTVLATLAAAGHRSWIVGGAVRDLLLGRERPEGADFDVATPATPAQVAALFPRTIPTGVEHGTITVVVERHEVEVTTFRGEGAYVDGRRPQSVTFLDDVDADLGRRDFTVNALAWDPLGGELRDPFGGRADLAARTIRAVGDPAARFGEDGLRPLRAVRFAAQLGFRLDAGTEAAIPAAHAVTVRVSAERVCEELTKLLVAPRAAAGLALLDSTGLLDVVVPELQPTAGRGHAIATAARARGSLLVKLAGLLHALRPTAARTALVRLRFPNRVADDVAALLRAHLCAAETAPGLATAADARRWVAGVGPRLAPDALRLWSADVRALPLGGKAGPLQAFRRAAPLVRQVLAARPPLATSELALDGAAVMELLGVRGGPEVGEALRHLLALVLEDPARNERPWLEVALRAWWAARQAARG